MLRALQAGLFALLAASLLPAYAHSHHPALHPDPATISVSDLPGETRDTLRAIKRGGPFAYPRDGVVFGNFEHVLPNRPRGYYREYTVKTPGREGCGSRRIISGQAGEFYYTADHYNTFKRIQE